MTEAVTESDEKTGQAKTLGLARWVQVAYMVAGLFLLWVFDKLGYAVWEIFAEPQETVVTGGAFLTSAGVMLFLYKHEKINRLTNEVIGELTKVTWPSGKETRTSTAVVMITSLIAAAILGLFDAVWSAITDLIYKV